MVVEIAAHSTVAPSTSPSAHDAARPLASTVWAGVRAAWMRAAHSTPQVNSRASSTIPTTGAALRRYAHAGPNWWLPDVTLNSACRLLCFSSLGGSVASQLDTIAAYATTTTTARVASTIFNDERTLACGASSDCETAPTACPFDSSVDVAAGEADSGRRSARAFTRARSNRAMKRMTKPRARATGGSTQMRSSFGTSSVAA